MCIRRVVFTALLLVAAPSLTAGPVTRYENGVVSVYANDATLAEVFESLAAAMSLSVRSAQALNRTVTIDVADQPVDQLVRHLLRQTSYTLIKNNAPDHFEIWIFAADGSTENHVAIGNLTEIDLEEIADEAAWNEATSALLDANSDTRVDALFALTDIDSAAAIGLVRVALNDPERSVRVAAIELLGDAGAVSILQESWWFLPSGEHLNVVDALGDIETPQSSSFLQVIAASKNVDLAAAAGQYLAERR